MNPINDVKALYIENYKHCWRKGEISTSRKISHVHGLRFNSRKEILAKPSCRLGVTPGEIPKRPPFQNESVMLTFMRNCWDPEDPKQCCKRNTKLECAHFPVPKRTLMSRFGGQWAPAPEQAHKVRGENWHPEPSQEPSASTEKAATSSTHGAETAEDRKQKTTLDAVLRGTPGSKFNSK